MEKRSTEGQMEYEWQNRSGPVDASSPFLKHAASVQNQQSDGAAKKRPFSVLDSPAKFNTFPSLRDPNPQASFLFSPPRPPSPSKPLPPTPAPNNPAFMTPRSKFESNYDSSELEANSSPEYNPDSDATPDNIGLRSGPSKQSGLIAQATSPAKDKKHPAISKIVGTSGKGELSRGHYSNAVEKRIWKKRSRLGDRWLSQRKDSSGSESDAEKTSKIQAQAGSGVVASAFSFIEKHPDIPHILSFYAQLLLNMFLVFGIIYIIYCFWSTIRSDVDKASAAAEQDIAAEVAACFQNYKVNKCDGETRAPALEMVCNNWEKCMKRDPEIVGRARISAHTFAEIFNSFIEPISYKAMIFTLLLIFGCVGISNFAFGFFRNKAQPLPTQPAPTSYMQSPHRHPADTQNPYWTAYQSPTARGYEIDPGHWGMESPTRRIQY